MAEGECLHIVALLCYCAVHRLVSHFETFSHIMTAGTGEKRGRNASKTGRGRTKETRGTAKTARGNPSETAGRRKEEAGGGRACPKETGAFRGVIPGGVGKDKIELAYSRHIQCFWLFAPRVNRIGREPVASIRTVWKASLSS